MHRDVGVLDVMLLFISVLGVELLNFPPMILKVLQTGRWRRQLEENHVNLVPESNLGHLPHPLHSEAAC